MFPNPDFCRFEVARRLADLDAFVTREQLAAAALAGNEGLATEARAGRGRRLREVLASSISVAFRRNRKRTATAMHSAR